MTVDIMMLDGDVFNSKIVALVNPARQIDREYFLDLYIIRVGANINIIGRKYPQSFVPDRLEL